MTIGRIAALDFMGYIWRTIGQKRALGGDTSANGELTQVNAFRNQFIAHSDTQLTDADLAWKELGRWMRTLVMMVKMG